MLAAAIFERQRNVLCDDALKAVRGKDEAAKFALAWLISMHLIAA